MDLYNEGLKLSSADKKLNASLHNNKGGALVALRRYALAIVECCKAIDLDEDLWHPYLLRHLAWKRVGVYTKAAEVTFLHFALACALHLYMARDGTASGCIASWFKHAHPGMSACLHYCAQQHSSLVCALRHTGCAATAFAW